MLQGITREEQEGVDRYTYRCGGGGGGKELIFSWENSALMTSFAWSNVNGFIGGFYKITLHHLTSAEFK